MSEGRTQDAKYYYGDHFYRGQLEESYHSARIYAQHLWQVYQPESVADFGCGRGPWLKSFGELGTTRLVGFDGPWNSQDQMIDQKIEFHPTDLNQAVRERFGGIHVDLAMTLEVVEHLEPEVSADTVTALCAMADVIVFGAAFSHQPGMDHINTRPHSFWGHLFAKQGYRAYDYFRPAMWGRTDIPYWYQQNTFLYVREGHPLTERLAEKGHMPLERLELLDFVHPDLLECYASFTAQDLFYADIKKRAKAVLPSPLVSAMRKFKYIASD